MPGRNRATDRSDRPACDGIDVASASTAEQRAVRHLLFQLLLHEVTEVTGSQDAVGSELDESEHIGAKSNEKLAGRLLRTTSATDELPDGRPARIRRPEAVEAVNKIMIELFPEIDLAVINGGLLDERELGRYERGEVRWPSKYRRAALRAFFNVQTDKDLGFYRSRALQPVLDAEEPDDATPTS